MLKRTIISILFSLIVLCSWYEIVYSSSHSSPSNWAKSDIEYMIHIGLVPKELQRDYTLNITREEFSRLLVPVLYMLTGEREELSKVVLEQRFSDTFHQDVFTAYTFGIINGYNEREFRPNRFIERKEAVVMMGNILRTLQVEGLVDTKAPYGDYAVIPSWAREAANITYNAKIFMGSNAGMEPDKPYTREQSIVTMKRLIDFVQQAEIISYRGKVSVKIKAIDSVRVGSNYIKIGSPKDIENFGVYWEQVSHNFPAISLHVTSPQVKTHGEFIISTMEEDCLIKVSW